MMLSKVDSLKSLQFNNLQGGTSQAVDKLFSFIAILRYYLQPMFVPPPEHE